MKLKDLLSVCSPDWLVIGKKTIDLSKEAITDEQLKLDVKEVTGWDDGLTIELFYGSSPCVDLPVGRGKKNDL